MSLKLPVKTYTNLKKKDVLFQQNLQQNLLKNFESNVVIDKNIILNIENICYDKFKEKWYNDLMLNDHSKLRTYRLFKNEYGKENYLLKNIPGKYKSAFAKFRCGVAPLKIETGRYEGIFIQLLTFNEVYS